MAYPELADRGYLARRYYEWRWAIARIADDVGCSPSAVHDALRRHDMAPRTAHRLPRADVERRLAKGASIGDLARHYAVHPRTIQDALLRWGLRGATTELIETDGIVRRYEAGASTRQLAGELCISRRTLVRLLRAEGATIRPPGRRAVTPS